MKTASFDPKTPGFVALALLGCLSLSLAAGVPDDPPREGRDGPGRLRADAEAKSAASGAARKLAEAPSYRWTTTVATGDAGPFGGSGGVTTGQSERGGFTRVAMPAAGRLEFVTRGGKAAVLLAGNWRVPASPRRGCRAGRAGSTRG